MFETWSLKKKLLCGFLVAAAFLMGVGGFSLYQVKGLDNTYSAILETNMPNMANIAKMRIATNRSAIALAQMSGANLAKKRCKMF